MTKWGGDLLVLQEYDPQADRFTGREIHVLVTFVTSLRPLYDAVGMSIKRVPKADADGRFDAGRRR